MAFRGRPAGRGRYGPTCSAPSDTVWIGDFTALRVRGRYRLVTDDGLSSHPFDVRPDVFDGARPRGAAGPLLPARLHRDRCRPTPRAPGSTPATRAWPRPGVRQGLARRRRLLRLQRLGDQRALLAPRGRTPTSRRARTTPNIPESGNGVPDLLDEARWGLGVDAVGPGAVRRASATRPARSATEPTGRTGPTACRHIGPARWARWPRRGPWGRWPTPPACSASTTRTSPSDASRAARARVPLTWRRARARDSDGPTCPAMRQDGDARVGRDVRMYAAAGMLLATGERRFRDDFEASYRAHPRNDPSFLRSNVYAALLYLRATAGAPARQAAIRERLRLNAAAGTRRRRAAPLPVGRPVLLGLDRGRLPADRGAFSAKACLEDPAARGRRLRAGAGQRALRAGPELPASSAT